VVPTHCRGWVCFGLTVSLTIPDNGLAQSVPGYRMRGPTSSLGGQLRPVPLKLMRFYEVRLLMHSSNLSVR
jgi:hypothetical protein